MGSEKYGIHQPFPGPSDVKGDAHRIYRRIWNVYIPADHDAWD